MEKLFVSAVSEWKGTTPYVHVSVETQDGKAVTSLKQSHFKVRELMQGLLPIVVTQFFDPDSDGGFYTLALTRGADVHGHGLPWTYDAIKSVVLAVEVQQKEYPSEPKSSKTGSKIKTKPVTVGRGQALAIMQS